MERSRACAAIIKNGKILLVHHRSAHESYWTLPGGGVEGNETYEQAALREVKEETGLDVVIGPLLFVEPYEVGLSYCYQAELLGNDVPSLGFDPEEVHLPREHQLLQGVAWHLLEDKKNDKQVSKVISTLGIQL
ncbi:MAG: NUDIX domain-containing protein [Anaerolineales bacterium]